MGGAQGGVAEGEALFCPRPPPPAPRTHGASFGGSRGQRPLQDQGSWQEGVSLRVSGTGGVGGGVLSPPSG